MACKHPTLTISRYRVRNANTPVTLVRNSDTGEVLDVEFNRAEGEVSDLVFYCTECQMELSLDEILKDRSTEAMSIIEIARQLQSPDLCPVCRQDWRKAGCSHQVLNSIEYLCREDIDALCDNIMRAQTVDQLLQTLARELRRCLRRQ